MARVKNLNLIHFDTIDSTNTWTKKNAHSLNPDEITCITALEQSAGRGRFNRKWLSPKGQNIYATLYFCLPLHCSYIVNVGQVLSLSCAQILEQRGFLPQIKWPNDILLEGKKVAGILCETIPFEDRIGIAVGIGIDINMPQALLDTIDQPATSLLQISGHLWELDPILESLLRQFTEDLNLLETSGFAPFHAKYQKLLAFKGKVIFCQDGERLIEGICHSITPQGTLNLLLSDGSLKSISSGELTLK